MPREPKLLRGTQGGTGLRRAGSSPAIPTARVRNGAAAPQVTTTQLTAQRHRARMAVAPPASSTELREVLTVQGLA